MASTGDASKVKGKSDEVVAAVFLDRDGVINEALVRDGKPYPPQSIDEFMILDGVKEACQRLKELGYLLIVATNQPDVGRGTLAREVVEEIHAAMCRELPVDRVEVCYHPGRDVSCDCRKPSPGNVAYCRSRNEGRLRS